MDHGPNHAWKVLGNINAVLEEALTANSKLLNDIEIYFLCASAWLHDIGMQVEFKDGTFRPYSSSLSLEEQKSIRNNHAVLTETVIKALIGNVDFAQQNSLIGSMSYNHAFRLLCGAHRGSDIKAIRHRMCELPTDVYDAIHLVPLIGFLQFADAAHMSKDRVVGKDIETLYLSDKYEGDTLRILEKQYFNCLYIDDASVSVQFSNNNNTIIHFKLTCSRSADEEENIIKKQVDTYWARIQRNHKDSIRLIKELRQEWNYSSDILWGPPDIGKKPFPSNQHIDNESITVLNTAHDIVILGLIGVGQSAYPQLAAVKMLSNLEFRYFSDIDVKSRDKLIGDGYNKNCFYSDHAKMLQVSEINTVVVATESRNHYKHAKEVLNAGKNLLLEKPAALCLNHLIELIQIAKDKNLCFVCSFHAAFDKTIEWVLDKENIDFLYNKYGWTNNLTRIRCRFYDSYLFESTPHIDRFYSLHDSWFDSGINALSVINKFINPDRISHKKSVYRMCKDLNFENTVVDAEVEYSFNETGEIIIHTSWIQNKNKKLTILTNNKNMEMKLDHTNQKISIKTDNKINYDVKEFDKNRLMNQYINLYEDFYLHLINRSNNLIPALKLHELLFKAIEN
jgi:predicted dehydrogenase